MLTTKTHFNQIDPKISIASVTYLKNAVLYCLKRAEPAKPVKQNRQEDINVSIEENANNSLKPPRGLHLHLPNASPDDLLPRGYSR